MEGTAFGSRDRCLCCGREVGRGFNGTWFHLAEFTRRTFKGTDSARTATGGETHVRRRDFPNRALCGVGPLVHDTSPGTGVTCKRCFAKLSSKDPHAVYGV